ncbi:hypothetical protein PISMIDRAFT_685712 [Pisolithus microcarpus 441]|uniref:Uncharacterized protein n=1 Tax=Pisolithus microcarpus 441 TaxID=765257 RepID=A0A0C9YSU8_9AGAM|nr:hypothetical protein PISMIDRAFT_685712 [Pisolithus microcarpus 441]
MTRGRACMANGETSGISRKTRDCLHWDTFHSPAAVMIKICVAELRHANRAAPTLPAARD